MSKTLATAQLYSPSFLLLCASYFFFAASFTMIIPELPAYLTSLGGAEYKGLIIGLFTMTAGISRPFSGKLTDTIGRIPVMIIGTLVCVVCSTLYPLLTSVWGFLLLRLVHGFSTGFKPTASSAYAADIAPPNRRGEAMGMTGVSMNVGSMLAPYFGGYLALNYSLDAMFYTSSAMALFSVLIILGLRETLEDKEPFRPSILKVKKSEIIDKSAIPPGIVAVCLYYSYGILLTIGPDHSVYVGIDNKGLFFLVFTIFSILSRLVAGRISDIYGRLPVMKISCFLSGIAIILLGHTTTAETFLIAGGFCGFSLGISSPAVSAWVIDRASDENRGRAMATMYIALEIGIGSGAIISQALYDNIYEQLPLGYLSGGLLAIVATIYLQFIFARKK